MKKDSNYIESIAGISFAISDRGVQKEIEGSLQKKFPGIKSIKVRSCNPRCNIPKKYKDICNFSGEPIQMAFLVYEGGISQVCNLSGYLTDRLGPNKGVTLNKGGSCDHYCLKKMMQDYLKK